MGMSNLTNKQLQACMKMSPYASQIIIKSAHFTTNMYTYIIMVTILKEGQSIVMVVPFVFHYFLTFSSSDLQKG